MVNHPNRGWRGRWTVDLASCTASHREGWVFRFAVAEEDPGAIDGVCVGQPDPMTPEHLARAARIASEAGEAYATARRARY